MILSKKIRVKSSKYYSDLGYDITDRYILIDILDAPLGSRSLVLAKCDYCNTEKEISYKNYNDNIKNLGKYACSIKCGTLKAKESNIEKWGVESVFQSDNFKDKSKKTLLEKWGVDHISKSDKISESKSNKMKSKSLEVSIRMRDYYNNLTEDQINSINEKRTITNSEKWGVENVSQNSEIKEKVRKTNLERWGGYTLESEILKSKVRKTNLKKWGVEYPICLKEIKEKVRKTNLERWGFEYASQSDLVKQKQKDTLLEKYNIINIMFSEDFRKKFNISNEDGYIKYIGDRLYEFSCQHCDNIYDIDYDNYYKRKLRKVNTCTKCFPIMENSSIKEKELIKILESIYRR
jgi:hypothetical protein